MGNGFIVVDEKDWAEMSEEQRSWAVYKTLHGLDDRLKKIENRPFFDKCSSFVGGLIGGAAAAVGIKWI